MSEKINAALSPEEWQTVQGYVEAGKDLSELDSCVADDSPGKHYVAAVNLHGQPFGFKYEMADVIARAERGEVLSEEDKVWMRTAVGVILALLPPRSSSEEVSALR